MLMSRIINDVNLISSSLPEILRIIQHSLTMVGLVGLVIYRDAMLAFGPAWFFRPCIPSSILGANRAR